MEATIERGAAPDVHRIEDAGVNWYLVEAAEGLTIVDAGVPRSWDSLHRVLREIGRDAAEIRALVLTHAHFDHIGFAERARRELAAPPPATSSTSTSRSPASRCSTRASGRAAATC
ncbi:MAG: MBL fold metallo-hydrolase [Solirubrobacterales bacterium]